jgi:hypothetical protein
MMAELSRYREQGGLDPALICGIVTRLEGWEEASTHGC